MKILEWLDGKKTHLSVIGFIVMAIVDYANGQTDLTQSMALVFGGLGISSLRAGAAKK